MIMVSYFFEDTNFKFNRRRLTSQWLKFTAESEIKRIGQVNIIFCSDNYILDINQKYLQHDYFTDIITFDYCEGNTLHGDIFVSLDTVRSNAAEFGTTFDNELHRILIHGILHLCGQADKTPEARAEMTHKANEALTLLTQI